MERNVLLSTPRMYPLIIKAQGIDRGWSDNVLRAALLAVVWPFAVIAGPSLFVELGCFSMTCFALACQAHPCGVLRGRSKLFWRSILKQHSLNRPKLFAHRDSRGVVHVFDARSGIMGISKPELGMYGRNVREMSIERFCVEREPSYVFEGEVDEIDGHRGHSYRVCTFRCRSETRVISIFAMSRTRSEIPIDRWNRLVLVGDRLAHVHASSQLGWAPLIGWDVMISKIGECIVLEGNLGGSASPQFMNATLGTIPQSLAQRWMHELRESHLHGVYKFPPQPSSVKLSVKIS